MIQSPCLLVFTFVINWPYVTELPMNSNIVKRMEVGVSST